MRWAITPASTGSVVGVAALPGLREQLRRLVDPPVERRELPDDAVAARRPRRSRRPRRRTPAPAPRRPPPASSRPPAAAAPRARRGRGSGARRRPCRSRPTPGTGPRPCARPAPRAGARGRRRARPRPRRGGAATTPSSSTSPAATRVQLRAAGGADLVVDRGGDQRVREGRAPGSAARRPSAAGRRRSPPRARRTAPRPRRARRRSRAARAGPRTATASSSRAASSEQAATRWRTIVANERGAGRLSCRCHASAGSSSSSARV